MKRFRYYILPRVCLALSVLVVLLGLWALWLSLGRPMPTRELACRQAEAAHFAPHGRTVAAGDVRFQHTEPHLDAWVVRRAGGRREAACSACSTLPTLQKTSKVNVTVIAQAMATCTPTVSTHALWQAR